MDRLRALLDKMVVTAEPGLSNVQLMLTNEDLRPVDPRRRQWNWLNFIAFWIADSLNINTWMISSSMIVDGLSWWQSWLCVWVGYFFAACFVCLTGRIGAIYHVPFPVAVRSMFGIWGSFWPIINRVVMAVIWYGVQSYIGGKCVTIMIQSIWPSYANLPNSLPPSAGIDTKHFLSLFLFWLLSLPALWFPVHKVRHLFTVKAYYAPVAAIAFFGWAIARANGIGPIVHQPNSIYGSELAWAVVKGIMTCLGNFAALIMNNPDFSRFSKTPKDAIWAQLFTIPAGFGITSFIGIIVSSSSVVIYGKEIWNPLDLLMKFQEGASSGQRFGIFVISLGFALAQLGTNIAANSVSAGTDMTALFPRYINIRRGSYICAAIGLAMCPWNLVSTSNQFTTYLAAYSLFLSSIAGVMICDYYFVRKGYLEVKGLYSADPSGPYYYDFGLSWRAYTAYICGILINIVGFAGAVGRKVPVGATYVYNLNYFTGSIVAAGVYYGLTWFFPIPATSRRWNEVDADDGQMSEASGQEDGDEENVGREETVIGTKGV